MEQSLSQPLRGEHESPAGDSSTTKHSISVQATGEVTALPDVVQFTISVRSTKETADEAQASVKRRTDYVNQVIKKHGVTGVESSTEVSKTSGNNVNALMAGASSQVEEMVTVTTDMDVKCDTLAKCEAIRNLLIEKMDATVRFSAVSFAISSECRQKSRQDSFKKAVTSARSKAECISQTVGVQLGSAIQVKELSQDSCPAKESVDPELDPHLPPLSLHQKHLKASWTFTSKVFVCFETHMMVFHRTSVSSKQY